MVLLAEPFPLAANAVRVPTWGVDHWIRECWIPMVGMNPCTGTTQSDRRIKFNNGYLIIKLEFWIMGWWRFNNNTSTDFEDKPWKEKANLNSWKRWNLEVASFFIWRLFGPLECVCTFIVLLDPIRTRAFVANSGTIWPSTKHWSTTNIFEWPETVSWQEKSRYHCGICKPSQAIYLDHYLDFRET
jgi:hypothetical protein